MLRALEGVELGEGAVVKRCLLFVAGLCLLAAAMDPSVAAARVQAPRTLALRFAVRPARGAWPSRLTARLDWRSPTHVSANAAVRQAATSTTIPMWSRKQYVGSTPYSYTMVGRNPFVTDTVPDTTVKTYVVALKIVNPAGDTFDPTAADACDVNGTSAETRLMASPIFRNKAYTWGGTSIWPAGAQVTDAFQRAEFWKYTNPSGINPGYHVRLGFNTTTHLITLEVDLTSTQPEQTGGCDPLLALEIGSWDAYLRGTIFPALESAYGVNPTDFVLFLVNNVVFYQGSVGNCCILGYHGAFGSPLQTYAIADYDTTGFFSAAPDIAPMSREVAGWMDDPTTANPTPPWGHVGQVSGCESNLEPGDPLAGTTFPVKLNAFTYHPQELAFFSWFYHQRPSIGANGWYSDQGTFATFAAPCS